MVAASPITQAAWTSRTALSGRFALTAVGDVARSSKPPVALRASIRYTNGTRIFASSSLRKGWAESAALAVMNRPTPLSPARSQPHAPRTSRTVLSAGRLPQAAVPSRRPGPPPLHRDPLGGVLRAGPGTGRPLLEREHL